MMPLKVINEKVRCNVYIYFALVCFLLTAGVLFRFTNLGKRIYWHDETGTSLRVAGYTNGEVIAELTNAPIISAKILLKYQRPSHEKSVIDTIKSIISDDPHHPPLYFLMSRFWAQWSDILRKRCECWLP